MHCGTVERASTPRKRVLSRAVSEDESLRHIIKEAEGSARRLMRTDSRSGSMKKLDRSENQSEEDLTFSEMLALQEAYNETLQEVRALELQREVLIFQVDCLQDALEGAEEMLAEAKREAGDASSELERERQARKKLEEEMCSLRQEMEKLREENTVPPDTTDGTGNATTEEEVSILDIVQLDDSLTPYSPAQQLEETPGTGSSETTKKGNLLSILGGREVGQSFGDEDCLRTPPLERALLESSVDSENVQPEVCEADTVSKRSPDSEVNSESPLAKFQRLVHKTFAQLPTLALVSSPPQDGIIRSSQSSPGEVVTLSSTEFCHDGNLQALAPGKTPGEALPPVHDTVPAVPQVKSGEKPSIMDTVPAVPQVKSGEKPSIMDTVPAVPQVKSGEKPSIMDTVPAVLLVKSGEELSVTNHAAVAEGNGASRVDVNPAVPGEAQRRKAAFDPKSHRNPESCTLS